LLLQKLLNDNSIIEKELKRELQQVVW